MNVFVNAFVHVLFPFSCPVCGKVGSVLCEDCLRDMRYDGSDYCLCCGGKAPCGCYGGGKFVLRSYASYKEEARGLLLNAKYGRMRRLVHMLGEEMAVLLDGGDFNGVVLIPPHGVSARGFSYFWDSPGLKSIVSDDFLRMLGESFAGSLSLPVLEWLEWVKPVGPQKGKTLPQRRMMEEDVFWASPECLDKNLILLDDVCTTGTTLLRGAQALYKGGARSVVSVCWGRRFL